MMRILSLPRLALAASLLALAAGLTAQTASPLPIKRPVVQVNLKVNEPYYLDAYKADIDKYESGINSVSGQGMKLSSKDKYSILLNMIDTILFRQYCDGEGIKVSDADIANQVAQYKSSLGPGATDAMVEDSLRRNGVFIDFRTYVKQDLLFTNYLRSKKPDEVKAISNPSSADVLKAYEDMKFNLRRPTCLRFTMITARTQGKSEADKKKAADAMRAIADQLKVNPTLFDEFLVKGAVDPRGAGYQTMLNLVLAKTADQRKLYPALYDAAFKLKEGEVSDLIADDTGYSVVRAVAVLPEKQLDFDDSIEGLTDSKASLTNPNATVLALVVNELQSSKFAELKKSSLDSLLAKLRKDATTTVSLASLTGVLEGPEIASLKALQGVGGYNIVFQ